MKGQMRLRGTASIKAARPTHSARQAAPVQKKIVNRDGQEQEYYKR